MANFTGISSNDAARVARVDLKLEAVVIPVSDVDRAKEFYGNIGWRQDADFSFDNGFRVVQLTPPGSGCSVQFGTNITSAAPGSARGLYLVVSDIEAARDDLIARVRDHERQEREEREARERRWREDQRQENLRREREWQRQREWERQHNRMIAQRGPNHTPAGWTQGKKTGWKGCDVPPGQAKPSGCAAVTPVQPVPPQAHVERRDNDHDRDDAGRTARVRDPNVRPQPPMSERH